MFIVTCNCYSIIVTKVMGRLTMLKQNLTGEVIKKKGKNTIFDDGLKHQK